MCTKKNLLFCVATVLFVITLGAHCTEEQIDEESLVETILEDGTPVSVPIYENLEFTEAKKEFDRRIFNESSQAIIKLSTELFEKNRSIFVVGLKNIFSLAKTFDKNRKDFIAFAKHDTSPKPTEEYAKSMAKFVKSLADARAPNRAEYGKDAHKRIMRVIQAIKQILDISPVGLYVDWNKLMIGDETMAEYVAPIIQGLHESSRRPMLMIFSKVGDVVASGLS